MLTSHTPWHRGQDRGMSLFVNTRGRTTGIFRSVPAEALEGSHCIKDARRWMCCFLLRVDATN